MVITFLFSISLKMIYYIFRNRGKILIGTNYFSVNSQLNKIQMLCLNDVSIFFSQVHVIETLTFASKMGVPKSSTNRNIESSQKLQTFTLGMLFKILNS